MAINIAIRNSNLAPFQGLTNRLLDDVGHRPTLFSKALSELVHFQNRPVIMILLIFKKRMDKSKP
ncbi:MAG: hypothetical protein GX857_02240 [Bacteroidales bacterium]|nr:hypothetical protein [Bacteroidales bacterium]